MQEEQRTGPQLVYVYQSLPFYKTLKILHLDMQPIEEQKISKI